MDLHETFRNLVAVLDDNSPKIKIVVGVVGLVGAGIFAAVSATKFKDDVKEESEDFENIKKLRKSVKHPEKCSEEELVPEKVSEHYSDKDYAKDVLNTTWRYSLKVVRRFGIPILIATASTILILNGSHVLSNRVSDLSSSLATVTTAYSQYRQKVIAKYGEDVDRQFRLGVEQKSIEQEEKVVDENGNEKIVKKKVKAPVVNGDPNLCSPYAFYFDESCGEYVKDITQREMYARAQQTLLNQQLKLGSRKWVTLSEIYDIFGRNKSEYTRDSLVVGIVYDENKNDDSDNYVDFRVQRVFVADENGRYIPKLLIDPNVEGSIYDKLPKALRYSDDCAV